jgi:hypothetical protein
MYLLDMYSCYTFSLITFRILAGCRRLVYVTPTSYSGRPVLLYGP